MRTGVRAGAVPATSRARPAMKNSRNAGVAGVSHRVAPVRRGRTRRKKRTGIPPASLPNRVGQVSPLPSTQLNWTGVPLPPTQPSGAGVPPASTLSTALVLFLFFSPLPLLSSPLPPQAHPRAQISGPPPRQIVSPEKIFRSRAQLSPPQQLPPRAPPSNTRFMSANLRRSAGHRPIYGGTSRQHPGRRHRSGMEPAAQTAELPDGNGAAPQDGAGRPQEAGHSLDPLRRRPAPARQAHPAARTTEVRAPSDKGHRKMTRVTSPAPARPPRRRPNPGAIPHWATRGSQTRGAIRATTRRPADGTPAGSGQEAAKERATVRGPPHTVRPHPAPHNVTPPPRERKSPRRVCMRSPNPWHGPGPAGPRRTIHAPELAGHGPSIESRHRAASEHPRATRPGLCRRIPHGTTSTGRTRRTGGALHRARAGRRARRFALPRHRVVERVGHPVGDRQRIVGDHHDDARPLAAGPRAAVGVVARPRHSRERIELGADVGPLTVPERRPRRPRGTHRRHLGVGAVARPHAPRLGMRPLRLRPQRPQRIRTMPRVRSGRALIAPASGPGVGCHRSPCPLARLRLPVLHTAHRRYRPSLVSERSEVGDSSGARRPRSTGAPRQNAKKEMNEQARRPVASEVRNPGHPPLYRSGRLPVSRKSSISDILLNTSTFVSRPVDARKL